MTLKVAEISITGIHYILKCITYNTVIVNCNNISEYYCFTVFLYK